MPRTRSLAWAELKIGIVAVIIYQSSYETGDVGNTRAQATLDGLFEGLPAGELFCRQFVLALQFGFGSYGHSLRGSELCLGLFDQEHALTFAQVDQRLDQALAIQCQAIGEEIQHQVRVAAGKNWP